MGVGSYLAMVQAAPSRPLRAGVLAFSRLQAAQRRLAFGVGLLARPSDGTWVGEQLGRDVLTLLGGMVVAPARRYRLKLALHAEAETAEALAQRAKGIKDASEAELD